LKTEKVAGQVDQSDKFNTIFWVYLF